MVLVNASSNNIRLKRNSIGTTIAELPMVLWLIFMGIGMPLLSLSLITARYALFIESAREAADAACSCQSFSAISGSSSTNSITLAQNTAVAVASTFPGIAVSPDNVTCAIVSTPLAGGNSTVGAANTSLAIPPDPSQNLYQIQVTVTGQIQPMLAMPLPGFLNIPGLSAPMVATTTMQRVYQNPSGLYGGPSTSTTSTTTSTQ